MQKSGSPWKIIGVLAAALATGGGGAVGYQVLEARQQACSDAIVQLRDRHDSDIASMRQVLDSLVVTSSRSAATLDMLVALLRDHCTAQSAREAQGVRP